MGTDPESAFIRPRIDAGMRDGERPRAACSVGQVRRFLPVAIHEAQHRGVGLDALRWLSKRMDGARHRLRCPSVRSLDSL